jgi:hypothetical protein
MSSRTTSPRRPSARNGRQAAALSFVAFGLIALAIVVALEFIDFNAGRYSFIFDRVLGLGRKAPAADAFQRDLAELLADRGIPHDFVRDRDGIAHLKIDLAEPLFAPLARDLKRLVERRGGVQVLSEMQGMREQVVYLYQVRFDRRLTHVILVSKRLGRPALALEPAGPRRAEGAPPAPAAGTKAAAKAAFAGTPRLAIVIDDIGYADLVSDQLHELGIPVTGAVIPAAPYARSEAQRLHAFGLEQIIHLPMQPKDPANHHPRDQFVLLDSSDGEIAALIDGALEAVPYARGANNHMGSLLTSNEAAARRVLAALKARGLFFVDSKTAPTTVAYAQARRLRVPTALRDVFLDDEPTYEHAAAQLRRLVEIARQRGRALAIGHPFPTTLAALRDAVPWLKQQGVEIVFVSQILQ